VTTLRASLRNGAAVLADRLRLADTHWTRLVGLLGTPALVTGDGLWLRPCRQVHTIGMRYPVDLAFLDADHRVVRTVDALPPGRVSPKVAEAESVLELPAGTLTRAGVAPGVALAFEGETRSAASARWTVVRTWIGNLVLAGFYAFFLLAHLTWARRTGHWLTIAPIAAQEALLVGLFLTRRPSIVCSQRPVDWAVGIAGTVLPLCMRTTAPPGPFAAAGVAAQVLGLAAAVVALAWLGRSVGIVAANRGVRSAGPYGLVRHPMYAAYTLTYAGYVVTYPTAANALILALTIAAFAARAHAEEHLLSEDSSYRAYRERVRWRFLPGLC
jgi:protein-S-isoprenylcysteine O-methyltransferase Ste14/uncharacterized membrane protein (UPF0127 family)